MNAQRVLPSTPAKWQKFSSSNQLGEITGCTVDGTVKGKSCVGGILGGAPQIAQTWNDYSITGNVFGGTATGEKYVGGIIGYYESLNKCDTIISTPSAGM